MDHLETSIQHERRVGLIFDRNVSRLLDTVKAREIPFIVQVLKVPLYSLLTKQTGNDTIKIKLPKTSETGEAAY